MTPKQRWLALLSGRKPDRLPCDYWATAEVTARLMRDLDCATERQLWRRLGVDKCIYLAPVHPAAPERTWHIQSLFSLWRVSTRKVSYGDNIGVYEEDAAHPLAGAECVADVENFPWPDPDEFDTSALRQAAAEWPDHPVLGATSEPFYLYCRLRGMEQALADLIEHPDLAEAILNRIFAFDHALIRRVLLEAGDVVDLVYLAEDLGTQDSLLISPALFRRYLKPRLARLVNLVHSHGKYVFHHDDGAIRPLVADLLETGIDILNPIQWRCRGMNRAHLAAEFGARVVFHGGIDNQQTLPFGSPADVRREVAESIQLLSAGRGYIVAPCHNIQPNTPTENIVALYQAVGDFGS
jgi:uroporphyrinogen decarboxylase